MIVRVLVIAAIMFPLSVSAHALGASLEKVVGDYHIDIGYDPMTPTAGDRIVFDFTLLRAAASTSVPFDYAWVRIRNNGDTLLATGIHKADFGPTSLLYSLPRHVDGELSVSVRYQRGEENLAEADFTIPVAPYTDPAWWHAYAISAVSGLAIGALGALLYTFWRFRRTAIAAQ